MNYIKYCLKVKENIEKEISLDYLKKNLNDLDFKHEEVCKKFLLSFFDFILYSKEGLQSKLKSSNSIEFLKDVKILFENGLIEVIPQDLSFNIMEERLKLSHLNQNEVYNETINILEINNNLIMSYLNEAYIPQVVDSLKNFYSIEEIGTVFYSLYKKETNKILKI